MWTARLNIVFILCLSVRVAEPFGWDVLVFAERWMPTACRAYEWRNVNNTCHMPDNPKSWAVHGISPTKIGTQGPRNCDKQWLLNEDDVKTIQKDLNQQWPDLHGASEYPKSIWAREWLAHGTCAADLKLFDTPLKYFNQSLQWFSQYNMGDALNKANIVPSDDTPYTQDNIYQAIKKGFGVEPHIDCEYSITDKRQLLSEIHICFDKSLKLVDCQFTMSGLGYVSSCDNAQGIYYPVTYKRG